MSDVKKLILLPSKVIEVEEEDGVKIYLNPHITANYNESDEFIRLEGSQGATAKIELSEIKEINGIPFAGSFADLRLLIDPIIVEANTTGGAGGGGGAVDATIVADNVGLAKEVQFNCKYTGFVIDLENPDSGTWPDYTFNIEQINFTLNVSPAFELSDFSQTYNDIRNTKELAEYLNCIQNYFYFVEVSPTLLGIMAGKLPVSEFNLFELNASGDILEYSSASLQYQTATEEFSTQDKLVLTLEQNAHKQNAPKGLATRREELAFPGGGLVLSVADLNPYREELIIKNTSPTNTLYIGYGSSTSETSYTWILQPDDIVTLTAGHRITGAWETGSASGTILITESI